jgi:lipoate-protein ligase A
MRWRKDAMDQVKVSWQLLRDPPRAGYENMARDQGLLDLADGEGIAVLRLYAWQPFCLSFGRNEPALRRYDRESIHQSGLDCVRRPTGGRAVWHARELTYAVAAPIAVFGSLRAAYREIHLMLSGAVRQLGAMASLAGSPARAAALDSGSCFASPAGGEVMVDGAKLIGSAQLQQGSALLQHGSLLLEDTQDMVHRVTRGSPPASQDRPLAAILGRGISFEEAAGAVAAQAEAWSSGWTPWNQESELDSLARSHAARFRSPEWTWRR